jgi:UDP-N-acetylmuramate--alanine ligase
MKIEDVKAAYFLGIGGIGMSALARWFNHRGVKVAGYDKTPSDLTKELIREGMRIHYEDSPSFIRSDFMDPTQTLVIYTPAIPDDLTELAFFRDNNFNIVKRSVVLGMISEGHYTIAVAGTHGKTTTCSMIAHLLQGLSGGCTAFVGGIMNNYNSNLLLGDDDAPVVVEADEFDRSFLQLQPNFTVVTSIDPDHLDIYENQNEVYKAFEQFVNQTDPKGRILMSSDAGLKISGPNYTSYDLKLGDVIAESLRIVDGAFVFTYRRSGGKISDIFLHVPGYHNVQNALAAITVAWEMGLSDKEIRTRMKTYKGVKRRFEYVVRFGKTIVIDDYAHHPTEIDALLKSVRVLYKKRQITVIFQPHLFSRTRDFQREFAHSLDQADDIILLPIYPAREKPIKDVTSETILNLMTNPNRMVCTKEELIDVLKSKSPGVLVTVGAGDIDREIPAIAELYKEDENYDGD